jgi:hypothetical protein
MTFRRCSVSVSSSIDAHDFVVTMLPPPADAASRSMRCKVSMKLFSLDNRRSVSKDYDAVPIEEHSIHANMTIELRVLLAWKA